MIDEKTLNQACNISEWWCADTLQRMLQGIEQYPSFDFEKVNYYIPKTYYRVIDDYVHHAIKQSVKEALSKLEPQIRADERKKIAEQISG